MIWEEQLPTQGAHMADETNEETVNLMRKTAVPTPPGRDAAVGYRVGNSAEGGVLCRGTNTPQRRPGAYALE